METAPLTAEELGPDSEINRAFRALGKPTVAAVKVSRSPAARTRDQLRHPGGVDQRPLRRHPRARRHRARMGHVAAAAATDRPGACPLHELYRQFRRCRDGQGVGPGARGVADRGTAAVLPQARVEIASCDRATLADVRRAINGGLDGTLAAGLELEGRLSKAATQRMDRAGFAATRAAVMSRGKEQSG